MVARKTSGHKGEITKPSAVIGKGAMGQPERWLLGWWAIHFEVLHFSIGYRYFLLVGMQSRQGGPVEYRCKFMDSHHVLSRFQNHKMALCTAAGAFVYGLAAAMNIRLHDGNLLYFPTTVMHRNGHANGHEQVEYQERYGGNLLHLMEYKRKNMGKVARATRKTPPHKSFFVNPL